MTGGVDSVGRAPKGTGHPQSLLPPQEGCPPINTLVLIHVLDESRIGIFRRLFACGRRVSEADD